MEMEKKDGRADLLKLPTDMLEELCKHLTIPDQLHFGSVCKPLLSLTSNKSNIWVPETPWVIANDDDSSQFLLYSNTNLKEYKIYKPFKPLRGSFIVGSFKGWLVMQSLSKLFMLNPFSRVRIELPPESTIANFLSPNGSADPIAFAISTCAKLNPISIALVTFGGDLAWCNIGDKAWKGYRGGEYSDYGNILFYKDKLYAINREGNKVDIFKLVDDESLVLLLSLFVRTRDYTQADIEGKPVDVYLVECGGRVYAVKRYYENTQIVRSTTNFVILEVEEKSNTPQLVKVNTLEDYILFVADYNCESLHSKNCQGLKGNYIYFIGYSGWILTGGESGEFSVTSETIRRMPINDTDFFTDPFWVLPRFVFECDCNCKCNSAVWIRPKKRRRQRWWKWLYGKMEDGNED